MTKSIANCSFEYARVWLIADLMSASTLRTIEDVAAIRATFRLQRRDATHASRCSLLGWCA
jgi:hypothetical protein